MSRLRMLNFVTDLYLWLLAIVFFCKRSLSSQIKKTLAFKYVENLILWFYDNLILWKFLTLKCTILLLSKIQKSPLLFVFCACIYLYKNLAMKHTNACIETARKTTGLINYFEMHDFDWKIKETYCKLKSLKKWLNLKTISGVLNEN